MTTKNVRLEDVAEAMAAANPELDTVGRRVAVETFRLMARGEPVSPEEIAEAAGLPAKTTEELLRSWPLTFWDDKDRVFRFWGLATDRLRPTHSMEIAGRTVYGWCAWDTLFITELLDTETQVTSTDPQTGDTIRLIVNATGVTEVEPQNAPASGDSSATMVSFLLPDGLIGTDAIASFCHYVHFFSSAESGAEWVADHPGTFLLTVDEAFHLGRLANELILAPPDESVPR